MGDQHAVSKIPESIRWTHKDGGEGDTETSPEGQAHSFPFQRDGSPHPPKDRHQIVPLCRGLSSLRVRITFPCGGATRGAGSPTPRAESGCLGLAGRVWGGSSWALVQLQGGVEGESLSWAQRSRSRPGSRQPIGACHPASRSGPAPAAGRRPPSSQGPWQPGRPLTQHPAPSHIPWLVPPEGGCRRRSTGLSGKRAPRQGANSSSPRVLLSAPPPPPPACDRGGLPPFCCP